MPEEKSKNKADAEAHEPCDEQERSRLHVLELAQHRHPLRHLASRLCEYLRANGRRSAERADSRGGGGAGCDLGMLERRLRRGCACHCRRARVQPRQLQLLGQLLLQLLLVSRLRGQRQRCCRLQAHEFVFEFYLYSDTICNLISNR